MLMMASVLFFACNDDDDDEPLSADKAKDELEQVSTDMITYMSQMETTDGMNAILTLDSLVNIHDPFNQKSSLESYSMIKNIKKFIMPLSYTKLKSNNLKTEGVVLSSFPTGTYTWNETSQQWDNSSTEPSDKLILNYPLEEKQAQFTINDYQEVQINDGLENWTQPTTIDAELLVDDTEAAYLSLSAAWVESGEFAGDPKSISVSGGVLPFTFTFNFNFSNYTATITDTKILYGNTIIVKVDAAATFEDDNMDDDPVNLSGYLQIENARLNIKHLKIKEIDEVIDNYESSPTSPGDLENAMNAKFSIDITIDNRKAADIILAIIEVEPEATTPTPIDIIGDMGLYGDIHLVYTDGTYESLFGMVQLPE